MSLLLFLASGAVSTLLDLCLFSLFLQYVDGSIAYVASYSICVILRYAFDAKKTFAAEQYALRHFVLYFLANCLLMLAGLLIFRLLALGMDEIYAKVISIPPVTLAGFFFMRNVVFRKKPVTEGEGQE